MVDKFSILLNPYPDEKTRAAAVFEQTGADMYIFPRFKEKRIQVDISPRKEVDVQLSSWTEITGSKDKDGTYDKKTWTEHHVIPETKVYLHIMELEFEGYDTEANKVMLFTDARREYGTSEEKQFKDITKYIRKDFSELKSGKHKDKDKAGTINVGFKNLDLPPNVGSDEYALKGAYFGMKFEAMEKLKGVNVITNASSPKNLDYYVIGKVDKWNLHKWWSEPHTTTYASLISSEETKWKDDKGKEHKMYTKHYREKITDVYGRWNFSWQVRAAFGLVNTKTGKIVVAYGNYETNDKPMDAYRSILRDFYKQVNKYFGK